MIAFLIHRLYPYFPGGVELFHYFFIKEISKKFPCLVFSFKDVNFNSDNVKVLTINPFKFKKVTLSTLYYHFKYLIQYRKKIQLIHIPYTSKHVFQCYHIIFFSKIFNIPYLLRIHGGGMYPCRPFWLHKLYFKNAAAVIAVSKTLKNEYEKRFGIFIKYIPSYLPFFKSELDKNSLRKKYGFLNNDTILLFVGALKKIKGPDILIKALHILGKETIKKHSLKLLLLGDGEMSSFLKEMVDKYDLSFCVKFLGHIPYEKIHEFYQIADIYVIPSLVEARPLALSEALYNGLPVIASNISTLRELIKEGENGLLFSPGSSEELSEKIFVLLKNSSLRESFTRYNKEIYGQRDYFREMVNEYIDLYLSLMEKIR